MTGPGSDADWPRVGRSSDESAVRGSDGPVAGESGPANLQRSLEEGGSQVGLVLSHYLWLLSICPESGVHFAALCNPEPVFTGLLRSSRLRGSGEVMPTRRAGAGGCCSTPFGMQGASELLSPRHCSMCFCVRFHFVGGSVRQVRHGWSLRHDLATVLPSASSALAGSEPTHCACTLWIVVSDGEATPWLRRAALRRVNAFEARFQTENDNTCAVSFGTCVAAHVTLKPFAVLRVHPLPPQPGSPSLSS